MKILYFTRDYTTHDRRFLSALADAGHQVYYLRLEQRGHAQEDRPLPPQIEIVSWAGGRRPVCLGDGPRLLADLIRVISTVKPDLVQSGPVQTAAFLVALSGFRPLVSMSWGYDLLFDANRNVFWRWATRYTLKHSAMLVGDCYTIRQKAIAFGMPDERIVTFPWGVDLEHFTPQGQQLSAAVPFTAVSQQPAVKGRQLEGYHLQPSCPKLSTSARSNFNLLSTRGWEPIYGVEVIARAFVQAAQEAAARQFPELHLIMLGNGSQAGLLRQIFIQGGVLDQVHFPGQVRQADLPRYYRSVDLYVSASHSDGSSISLLEAMACGRPALVSDIPGNQEWVEPGVNGWWFPDGDAGALAQAILCAIEERQRLPEMGLTARSLAEQRADWKKNFQQLQQVYEITMRAA